MISTLQGLVGVFDAPINAELRHLIKLTTALSDEKCGEPGRRKKRK